MQISKVHLSSVQSLRSYVKCVPGECNGRGMPHSRPGSLQEEDIGQFKSGNLE